VRKYSKTKPKEAVEVRYAAVLNTDDYTFNNFITA
jgi:hypothetical protein